MTLEAYDKAAKVFAKWEAVSKLLNITTEGRQGMLNMILSASSNKVLGFDFCDDIIRDAVNKINERLHQKCDEYKNEIKNI